MLFIKFIRLFFLKKLILLSIISIYVYGFSDSNSEIKHDNMSIATCKKNTSNTPYKCSCKTSSYEFDLKYNGTCPKKIKVDIRKSGKIKIID